MAAVTAVDSPDDATEKAPVQLLTPEQVFQAVALGIATREEARCLLGLGPDKVQLEARIEAAPRDSPDACATSAEPIEALDAGPADRTALGFLRHVQGLFLAESPVRVRARWREGFRHSEQLLRKFDWPEVVDVDRLKAQVADIQNNRLADAFAAATGAQLADAPWDRSLEAANAFGIWMAKEAPDGAGAIWEYHAEKWLDNVR